MEVNLIQEFQNTGNQALFPRLSVGDQIAVRVQKRIQPFHYLVIFRGKQLFVNSAVHLKPGEMILIQLQKSAPRFVFKLLTRLPSLESSQTMGQMIRSFGLGNDNLSRTFFSLAVNFQTPIRIDYFKNFRKMLIKRGIPEKQGGKYLLTFLWSIMNLNPEEYHDPLYSLSRFFDGKREGDQKFKQSGKGNPAPPAFEISEEVRNLVNELEDRFSLTRYLDLLRPGGFEQFDPDLSADSHLSRRLMEALEKIRKNDAIPVQTREYYADTFRFYLDQLNLYAKSQWACFPIFDSQSGENFFTFCRKNEIKNDIEYEFLFNYVGERIGEINVRCKILNRKINIIFYGESQGISGFVDNDNLGLSAQLKAAGFRTIDLEVVSGKDTLSAIGKRLLEKRDSKLEVLI